MTQEECACFSVMCHICDAISCKANGPIFEVLNLKYEGVCLSVCPPPSISTPMGQSVPDKRVQVQFDDFKINIRTFRANHSVWLFQKCGFLKEGCVPLEKCLESVVTSFITGASQFFFIHVYIHYLHLSALESKPACPNMLFKMVHVELCISKVSVRFQT